MLTSRRALVPTIVLTAVLLLAACGSDDGGNVVEDATKDKSLPTIATTESTTTTTLPDAKGKPCKAPTDVPPAEGKPEVQMPEGVPPTELVSEDIKVGDGAAAALGDTIKVQYVGISCSTGTQFDASWDRGEATEFPLTEGGLIKGWTDGIPGMKVGGRRRLVIPPDLAYGADGRPGIAPNETLVFVIDLVDVTPASETTTTSAP